MQSFIVEHYLNKAVDVYCGGPDVFKGTIEACADNVLTLNNEGKFTHVAIDKIIALWAQWAHKFIFKIRVSIRITGIEKYLFMCV